MGHLPSNPPHPQLLEVLNGSSDVSPTYLWMLRRCLKSLDEVLLPPDSNSRLQGCGSSWQGKRYLGAKLLHAMKVSWTTKLLSPRLQFKTLWTGVILTGKIIFRRASFVDRGNLDREGYYVGAYKTCTCTCIQTRYFNQIMPFLDTWNNVNYKCAYQSSIIFHVSDVQV